MKDNRPILKFYFYLRLITGNHELITEFCKIKLKYCLMYCMKIPHHKTYIALLLIKTIFDYSKRLMVDRYGGTVTD